MSTDISRDAGTAPVTPPSPAARSRRTPAKAAGAVLVLLICASLPLWAFPDDYSVGILMQIAIYAGYGLSWHLLAGYTGQYAFGHAAFFGAGAYVMAIFSYHTGLSPWLGLGLAAIGAAVVGLLVGLIALRVSGLFFGLITFGTALMLGVAANQLVGLTGGAAGLSLPLHLGDAGMMQFDTQVPLYEITLVIVAGYLLLTWALLRSRLGLLFRSVRDDPVAADASGVNIRGVRLGALCLSAAMAGLIGAIYAQSLLFIDPESAFGLTQSVNAIFTAIIGGMGSLFGPVLGAAVFVLLREVGMTISDGDGVYSVLFYSTVVFVFIMVAPKGLVGIGRRLFGLVRRDAGKRE
ncbi:branched-chain amino acid ABC transporter permease [Sphaerisporangium rufum]|uniref:Branched-chain amino acid ABC transporter permease n=1 Tax=Sphaerisporangium rufum TaxID=1381558 RepID=A0A919QY56_9ACTN|nr:branched-chain amino acid ABC transporter permease [Sphaerisporangium rufum]GII75993.1 branched-chain amino acid ABC transporter permease [Sphaerisporangium rufum]